MMRTIFLTIKLTIAMVIASHLRTLASIPNNNLDSGVVKLRILYADAVPNEQFVLIVPINSTAINISSSEVHRYVASPVQTGEYVFKFKIAPKNIKSGAYIFLYELSSQNDFEGRGTAKGDVVADILENYFVQNGDDLTISVKRKPNFTQGRSFLNNFALSISGKGAYKLRARQIIDSIRYSRDFKRDFMNSDTTYRPDNGEMKIAYELLTLLEPMKSKLDKDAFEELKLHAYFSMKYQETTLLRAVLRSKYQTPSKQVVEKFIKNYEEEDEKNWSRYDHQALIDSYDFWKSQHSKYRTITFFKNGFWLPDSLVTPLIDIKDQVVREEMFIMSIKDYMGSFNNMGFFFNSASKYVISPKGKAVLDELVLAQVGQRAYNFELTNSVGKKVRLSDYKGKVVFIDFWYTGCGSCVEYYADVLSKVEERFKNDSNFVFISISIDKDFAFWKKSITSQKYTSPDVINLFTNGQGTLNEVIKFYNVYGYPRPLIIDRYQKIYQMDKSLRDENPLIKALTAAAFN